MTLFFLFDLCYHRSVSRAANGPYMSCQGACLWCFLTAVLPFACLTLSRCCSATAPHTKRVSTICCVFSHYKKLLLSLSRDVSGILQQPGTGSLGTGFAVCSFQHNVRAPFLTAEKYISILLSRAPSMRYWQKNLIAIQHKHQPDFSGKEKEFESKTLSEKWRVTSNRPSS